MGGPRSHPAESTTAKGHPLINISTKSVLGLVHILTRPVWRPP
ncbi:hypothetical protein FTUN_7414 [Frigoriglobus tundricola]|uniref:Uncharacterized protein n=1 Tax=Frigoriglobus tundricola TaxID=2774151 RepID=A0A6M5Z2X9_9BACT|nr:hypothetical protein FTUN_7414 [Frigoriglobus tundricola]